MRRVLIVGAASAIAEAAAREFARRGDALFLVGRSEQRLEAIAADLRARGAPEVGVHTLDINDLEGHAPTIAAAEEQLGGLDTVLIAHGTLPDQAQCEADPQAALRELHTNAIATIALLTVLANRFEDRQGGTIAVMSSVAGDRGRQSNYVYGTAKAALDTFMGGLRQRLHKAGVRVVTIKPGFVDTPMTQAFDKNALWATPERVGARVHRAVLGGPEVVYTPPFWRLVMLVIRLVPGPIFKRVRL